MRSTRKDRLRRRFAGARSKHLFRLGAALVIAGVLAGPAQAHAAVPGANGSLMWVSAAADVGGTWLRFSVGPSGANLQSRPVHRRVSDIVAAPGGRRIAYQYGQQIFVARRDGSHARRLARRAIQPGWAPDGEHLVYVQVGLDLPTRHVDAGLMVRRVDGTGARRLTRGDDGEPAWSPRGDVIAFVRPHGRARGCALRQALYIIPAMGGRVRPLLLPQFLCAAFTGPDWAPRGNRLVVSLTQALDEMGPDDRDTSTDALAAAQRGVNIVGLDGSRKRVLPFGSLPTWSPDGREIAYFSPSETCGGDPADTSALCATTPRGAPPRMIAPAQHMPLGLVWFPRLRR
jgi:Tol biopolymer transport system component